MFPDIEPDEDFIYARTRPLGTCELQSPAPHKGDMNSFPHSNSREKVAGMDELTDVK